MSNMNLMENKEFVQEFLSLESAEELENLFAKYGIQKDEGISWDSLYAEYKKALNNTDDQLDEADLENVAGGSVFVAAGIIVGVGAVIGGGFAIAGVVKWAKAKRKKYFGF